MLKVEELKKGDTLINSKVSTLLSKLALSVLYDEVKLLKEELNNKEDVLNLFLNNSLIFSGLL